jgi:cytoskeletal protein RodZ
MCEMEVGLDTTTLALVIVILVLLAVIGWLAVQMRRSKELRQRFGPEYDQTVQEVGDRRKAEAELEAREKRVRDLNIRALSPEEHEQYAGRWKATQARFVDDPGGAVTEANRLVKEVMEALGYPVGNFEQRAADLSVDHAAFVSHYRAARQIVQDHERGQASTEDLRRALVHYRGLFEDLLAPTDVSPQKEMSR